MKILFALAVFIYSSSSFAVTGNDLYSACNSSGKFEKGFCSGFIQAAKYSIANMPNMSPTCKEQLALAPLSQLKDVVLKELINRPEQRHYSAFSIAYMSLAQGFGCIPSEK